MSKRTTSVTIESQLADWAKERRIPLSRLIENKIKELQLENAKNTAEKPSEYQPKPIELIQKKILDIDTLPEMAAKVVAAANIDDLLNLAGQFQLAGKRIGVTDLNSYRVAKGQNELKRGV